MRAIEFRAYDAHRKKMVYRNLFDMNWYYTPNNDEHGCHLAYSIQQRDRHTLKVMQFTGLLDRNGVKIFESDILKWPNGDIGIIEYDLCLCAFRCRSPGYGYNMSIGLNIGDKGGAIVSGNIFQNPELLEQKE